MSNSQGCFIILASKRAFRVLLLELIIVPMHVPFRIHYRNNLINKKDSYPIPRPPSWDDRNCSYGHQFYPSEYS
jgi:hypothetical protein